MVESDGSMTISVHTGKVDFSNAIPTYNGNFSWEKKKVNASNG